MRNLLVAALLAACSVNAGAWGFGGWGGGGGTSTADPQQTSDIADNASEITDNDAELAQVGIDTATNSGNISSNDVELAQVGIDTAAINGRVTAIETIMSNPVFASSRVANIPITAVFPAFQSVSTTAVTFNGGRPYFLIISISIANGAGVSRAYQGRLLRDGVPTGIVLNEDVDGGEDENISFHWAEDTFSSGMHNFTFEVNTDSGVGTQTINASRVTVVEM